MLNYLSSKDWIPNCVYMSNIRIYERLMTWLEGRMQRVAAVLLSKQGKHLLLEGRSITRMIEEIETVCRLSRVILDETPSVHPGI